MKNRVSTKVEKVGSTLHCAQGTQGKWPKNSSYSGKTQGFWKCCQNTGNLAKSQGIPYSKDQGYCNICRDYFSHKELNVSTKSVLHIKQPQHIEVGTGGKMQSDREKTGNLKIEFE